MAALSFLFRLLLVALVGILVCGQRHIQVEANAGPLSLDDILEMEGVGNARIDPTGRWLIYERIRPYGDLTDYSFRTYAMRWSGHQLWRYDLFHGGAPELLPGIDTGPSTYLGQYSEDGRYLSLYQYNYGRFSIGIYNTNDESVYFPEASPAFSRTGKYQPVWISPEELVYSGLPSGRQPITTSFRSQARDLLLEAWSDAWSGHKSTAQEFSSEDSSKELSFEQGKLVLVNARTKKTRLLAAGLFEDIRLSPDGKNLVALVVSRPKLQNPNLHMLGDQRSYHLVVVNIETGLTKHLLPEFEFLPQTLVWSPDSRRIGGFGWKVETDYRHGRFRTISVQSRQVQAYEHAGLELVLETERGWFPRPERVLLFNDAIAVFARPTTLNPSETPDFLQQSSEGANDAPADWYLIGKEGTSKKNLTQDLRNVAAIPVFADADSFVLAAQGGVFRVSTSGEIASLTRTLSDVPQFVFPRLFGVPPSLVRHPFQREAAFVTKDETGAKVLLLDVESVQTDAGVFLEFPKPGSVPIVALHSAKAVVFQVDDRSEKKLVLSQLATGVLSLQELVTVNSHLNSRSLGEWEPVVYAVEDSNGVSHTVESCVLLPEDFDPLSPPPIVVEVYPNTRSNCGRVPGIDFPNPHTPYLWAGRGFAYSRLSLPRELIQSESGPIDKMDEVVAAGIDAIGRERLADPERVILYGFSQGGISALFVASQLDMFTAVIASNSWADLISHYFGGQGMLSYAYGEALGPQNVRYEIDNQGNFSFGVTPFDAPMTYLGNSPVFLAPQINSPILLIHSDMDSFSMAQFDEMYGALRRAGKKVRYIRYLGEGHLVSSPANIRHMWERVDSFLRENGVAR